nr:reverse transcriptase domain-containing protein [Tanacetum cinerariifolium]
MPPKPMSKARMREIIRDQFATSMNEFMANMNNGAGGSGGVSGSGEAGGSAGTGGNADRTGVRGAGPTVPKLTGCTYATFIKCDPLPFNGTEGAVVLCQWFEKLESVFQIKKDWVKSAMATLRGRALTSLNGRTKAIGIKAANNTPWSEVRKWMTEEFCPRSVIQRMEQELYNLRMKGMYIDGVKVIEEVVEIIDVSTTVVRTRGEVRIPLKNKALIIEGDRNQSRLKIISCIKARKYIENGCELFLTQVTGTVFKEKRVEDVPVIRDFPKVFREDLPGLPPPRQVEFRIDLIPGATPVARAPYRLAPSELKELYEQLRNCPRKVLFDRVHHHEELRCCSLKRRMVRSACASITGN